MEWDWSYTGDIIPDLLRGLRYTVIATLLGYLIAVVLGLVWALLRRTPNVVVRQVVRWVTEFIRCTPLIPQLFFAFYVLPTWGLTFGKLTVGVLMLGIHYSTYMAEVYRAGIADVPRGQWEAAKALNLPRTRVWLDVVLPQAVRKVIPTLGNYLIAMFKDSPLLLAIGVPELLTSARSVGARTFEYLEPMTMVGVLFIVVSVISSILLRRLERHYATN
ncbi:MULTISPECIES: ectoine/hydroxyectoine ABC transporter permease subunit EhuD [Actinomadura]|uniref:Ectoine/hydroxyectoine ABC transporter permease subunit EhuD n=1 Tax=Actinomadura litoris TaxID=2678616 RepID=A0A7K1L4B7_9ACTN|nr:MULTISPECIES: ectoine/hydroxyectoine ABC transporter permease subunit EhuD [Actinomadura]MBT2209934.1 ectoine/hydroxyectoine ABC transporter permease subunit EhuD [Actinomadura sp. NEAU-AAG7]MUN39239.1 ectoine/hydroxyectoine ABC transporter permease subunit EhuD [Actinomadura litoris]